MSSVTTTRESMLALPVVVAIMLVVGVWVQPASGQAVGRIEIDVLDQASDQPLSFRAKIVDSQGRPQRVRGGVYRGGWNLLRSPLKFRGRPGEYRYQVSRGPEYAAGHGGFTLDKRSRGFDVLRLPRHANLSSESWLAGDLASLQPSAATQPWLEAEGLSMAVAITRVVKEPGDGTPGMDDDGRWVESDSYWDSRPGSGLVFHHWQPPAEVPSSVPSSQLIAMAKPRLDPPSSSEPVPTQRHLPVHIEIQKLWARDVPLWLASRRIDSIQLLGPHLLAEAASPSDLEVPVDPEPGRFRGPRSSGQLVEAIYWKVLDAGLKIPPTAGSGFGLRPTHLGYNRVYASVASDSVAEWWAALRSGRSFVTNGPLLRVFVNEMPPGTVFRGESGETIDLQVALALTVSDPVDYLDVIFNGRTLYQARLDEHAARGGQIPLLSVEQSGWLVVRVVTGREDTYRLASTAPYFVEIGGQPRVSRSAVVFFQQWLEKTTLQTAGTEQEKSAAPYIESAQRFWESQMAKVNAP